MKLRLAFQSVFALGVCLAGGIASCSVDTSDLVYVTDNKFNAGGTSGSDGGANGTGNNGGSGASTSTGGASGGAGSTQCTVGEIHCSDDGFLQTCQDGDPPAFDAGKDCGSVERCDAEHNKCLECAPGEFRCTKENLEQCDQMGGAFQPVMACLEAVACVADGQKGYCKVCEPGTVYCDTVFVSPSGGEGNDGQMASQVRTCSANGATTDLAASCGASRPVCDIAKKSCAECTNGTHECRGSDIYKCTSGHWDYQDRCDSPAACDAVGGSCDNSGIECAIGQVQCLNDGELQTCGIDGQWQTEDNCGAFDLCDPNTYNPRCLPCKFGGGTQCNGDTLYTCQNAFNSGEVVNWQYEQCAGGGCNVNGYCDTCIPGEWECWGQQNYYTCDGDGFNHTYQDCGAGNFCDGTTKMCLKCWPNSYRCDPNGILFSCNGDGTDETQVKNCKASGLECNPSVGKCLPKYGHLGGYSCTSTGDFVYIELDGTLTTIESCGDGNCDSGSGCFNHSCGEGLIACDNKNVQTCNGNYYEDSGTVCSSTLLCQPAMGCATPIALGAGYAHSCAILGSVDTGDPLGYAVCWGANDHGQLGNGSELLGDSVDPRRVVFQFPADMGGGDFGGATALDVPAFAHVCGGRDFSCADINNPDAPGQFWVACWGSNEFGQLGIDSSESGSFNGITWPFFVLESFDPNAEGQPGLELSHVACGAQFACALSPTGTPYCWGRNNKGQLGADLDDEFMPHAIEVGGGLSFVTLFAGGTHACGVEDNGSIWCWGDGAKGQLGLGNTDPAVEPTKVGTLKGNGMLDAKALALGLDFTGAQIPADDHPQSWGGNYFGQLADGTIKGRNKPASMAKVNTKNAGFLFGGSNNQHFCYRDGKKLSCVGANVFGQLGDATTDNSAEPQLVWDGLTDAKSVADLPESVAVGGQHTCAINAKNEVWCWGANHQHQLASTKSTPVPTPTKAF